MSPAASVKAMTLPESNPATTLSFASTGGAVPRSDSFGTGSSPVHCDLPVSASSACTRPSTDRTITRSPVTSGAASTSLLTDDRPQHLARRDVERDHLAVARADRDDAGADTGTRGQVGLRVLRPLGATRCRIERDDLAVARRRVEDAAIEREAERETQLFAAAADARVPQLLDRERRLQVHQLGGRFHALLVLVAAGDQDQQARHAGGRDQ